MPPRTTRKSYRPRASDRTMVGTLQPSGLSVSSTDRRRHCRRMKPREWKKQIDSSHHARSRVSGALGKNKSFLHYVGWKSENIRPQERYFFLTSPFIELLGTWLLGLLPVCWHVNGRRCIKRFVESICWRSAAVSGGRRPACTFSRACLGERAPGMTVVAVG